MPVNSGIWRCGHLLVDLTNPLSKDSHCVLGEAVVRPDFDLHNFTWMAVSGNLSKQFQSFGMSCNHFFTIKHFNQKVIASLVISLLKI